MRIAICDDDQFNLDVVKGMITSCETVIPYIIVYVNSGVQSKERIEVII